MELDRRILLVDGPDGALQQLALDLIGRDFDLHYANDLDEAQLIALEAGDRIIAVLFSTSLDLGRVPDLASRFRVEPAALIPVGPRPDEEAVAALAAHGVRWHLFDDPPDESVRFVISGVLFDQDPFEIRYHLRVPTSIPATLEIGSKQGEATMRDIGSGGACLLGPSGGREGDRGQLRFEVDDQPIEIPVRVCWDAGEAGEAGSVCGVSFQEVDPEAGRALDRLREAVIGRHRITKSA